MTFSGSESVRQLLPRSLPGNSSGLARFRSVLPDRASGRRGVNMQDHRRDRLKVSDNGRSTAHTVHSASGRSWELPRGRPGCLRKRTVPRRAAAVRSSRADLGGGIPKIASVQPQGRIRGSATRRRRSRSARSGLRFPDHVERRTEVIEPKCTFCPCGCGEMARIGKHCSERQDFVPAKCVLVETLRPRYACNKCKGGGVVQAAAPPALVGGGLPTEALPRGNPGGRSGRRVADGGRSRRETEQAWALRGLQFLLLQT